MNLLCKKIGFPKDAANYIHSVYNGITHNNMAFKELLSAKNSFLSPTSTEYKKCIRRIHEEIGINIYTINLILVLACAKNVKTLYDKNGISEKVYFDTMCDISLKLQECKKLYDIWGIFNLDWYRGIFTLQTFKLGRLEYEIMPCPFDSYKDYAKKGDIIYRCYIPSDGPLTPESVIDSLKYAFKFFGIKDKLIVYCKSWLIYPEHYQLFPKGSNLRAFYDLFDITDRELSKSNENLWRIFYKPADTPVDRLPSNTTLQRNFKEYLRKGNYIGIGTGMLVFDGEKVIK